MGTTTVNSKKYVGNNIRVTNNRVFVDGKEVTEGMDAKTINIHVEGGAGEIHVDCCESIVVNGPVSGGVVSSSGDIKIVGDVDGDVISSSGDVECEDISGQVTTSSGDVIRR